MEDRLCVEFLKWALPRLRMRWAGFRKVRKQVCKRLDRRIRRLGLNDIDDYRARLDADAGEWVHLDSLCRITISRFSRDRGVFQRLAHDILPVLATAALARRDRKMRIWSAGCASGEEPYTLAILWQLGLRPEFPELGIEIVATDVDPRMLDRAREARYRSGSLKELSAEDRSRAFTAEDDWFVLRPGYGSEIRFIEQDIRHELPDGRFDLVLCRNLVFTYFDTGLQRELAGAIIDRLRDGAALVIGAHEHLPAAVTGLVPWLENSRIYRKNAGSD